jgi:predicted kinase
MKDSTKPVLAVMVGLPASGKSTYAYKLAQENNAIIFSSDDLREELYGDVNDQEHNHELFVELHRRIKKALKEGHNVIYDACNLSSKRRIAFLQELKHIPCWKECIIMATPYQQCLHNNKARSRKVPEHVIERMCKQFDTPYYYEGFNRVTVQYYENSLNRYSQYPMSWALDYMDYKQDNPHHKLTLGQHCMKAMYWLYGSKWFTYPLIGTIINATVIHDCGKPFCKTFKNGKGETTDIAHYYGHEHIGAYDSLFFKYVAGINALDVSALISNHMKPWAWERDNNEKMRNKYLNLWGSDFYQCVMILHEADKAAH